LQSPDGFVIGVYDKSGKLLNLIKKDYKKIKFTAKYEEAAIAKIKGDPAIKAAGCAEFSSGKYYFFI